jgi:hypothetical protein
MDINRIEQPSWLSPFYYKGVTYMMTKQCASCGSNAYPGRRYCMRCVHAQRDARLSGQTVPAQKPVAVEPPTPAVQMAADRTATRATAELRAVKARYTEALKTIERQEAQLHVVAELKNGLETHTIAPSAPSGRAEATVVVVASDWHIEETVGAEVGGLNNFNIEIARARAEKFFVKAHRLSNLLAQDIEIPIMVLALLGDFISGHIHDELVEGNGLMPMHAIVEVQNMLASGIEYLLANSDRKLVIPCHSGNHARTTLKTRFATENGHSLEYLMYVHLAAYFRNEPRVTFIIPEGPHSYLDIYGQTVRFQHGHMVKYGGGVGGIYIPVHKAIAMWNRARHADLDVFGHFHQLVDGGNFLCNGSLIGYNSFALSIKAAFDQPKQALFLLDSKRGRTFNAPILL